MTTDFAELFARDPLSLTKDDISQIVAKFRESRKAFSLGNAKAGSTKAPTKKEKEVMALQKKLGDKLKFDL